MHFSIPSLLLSLFITSSSSLVSASPSAQFNSLQLLKNSPSKPLGLIRHLHSQSRSFPTTPKAPHDAQSPFLPPSSSSTTNKSPFKAHYFSQKISHDVNYPFEGTFEQRYWYDPQFYKEGGPIFFLDGGETDGEGRLNFLEEGILRLLAEETGGMGVVHEHRYYGTSIPVSNLTTDSLRFLTTNQSLLDSSYFAHHVRFEGIAYDTNPKNVPWIYYGGSYAGAKAALARKGWGGTWWGAIASSGVTVAIEDYWEYFEPIRANAPKPCIALLQNHTLTIDSLLSYHNTFITSSLKRYFGLGDISRVEDFVSTLSTPLGLWQGRNWDERLSSGGLEEFCGMLLGDQDGEEFLLPQEVSASPELFPGIPTLNLSSFASYASYIKKVIVPLCPPGESQDACFGVDGYASNTALEEAPWRSWTWQVCTEWGYFMPSPPEKHEDRRLISNFITLEYTMEICKKAFPDGELISIPKRPEVWKINQFGGYELEEKRLAFVDGSEDPWIGATPHSHHAKNPNRTSTLSKPFHLIPGGVHHWDENSLLPPSNPLIPKMIKDVHRKEVEWVKSWLEDWEGRGKWRIDPMPDPGGDW